MARLLRMPEVAANTLAATLSQWSLGEAAAFSDGDAIATVETDKAVVDVAAEGGGVLVRTLLAPGTTVAVGTPMALLADPGEVISDVEAVLRELGAAQGTPAPGAPHDGRGTPAPGAPHDGRVFASPLARRLARELGLSLGDLHGTGPGGRIVRDDVRRAAAASAPEPSPGPVPSPVAVPSPVPSPAPSPGPVPSPAPSPGPVPAPAVAPSGAGYRDVPHTRMRRAIASRLTLGSREVPAFQLRGSARVDALLALRAQLNASGPVKISVNDLVVAAVARALVAVPDLNVIWTPDAVRRFAAVDVSVAVATDRGLVTPVLRDVGHRTVTSIAVAVADLTERARAGVLRQDELEGGALTVSNLGAFGVEDFTAVINPPQAAILAVGAARPEAVVTDGAPAVATLLRVTLSVDHRPVDGVTAARWLQAFLALVEEPLRILA